MEKQQQQTCAECFLSLVVYWNQIIKVLLKLGPLYNSVRILNTNEVDSSAVINAGGFLTVLIHKQNKYQ